MTGTLGILLAVVWSVLVAASPAGAADYVTEAGAALRQDVLYVDAATEGALTPAERTAVRDRLATATTPVYVALLPAEATQEAQGDAGRVPYLIYRAAGRPGTYAVIVGTDLHAGSTVIGAKAGVLASRTAAAHGDPATALLAFVDEVEAAAIGEPPADLANSEGPREERGLAIPWLLIAAAAVGGLAFVRARRAASLSRPNRPPGP